MLSPVPAHYSLSLSGGPGAHSLYGCRLYTLCLSTILWYIGNFCPVHFSQFYCNAIAI